MDKGVTPPKRVTSPTWGPPPPCKQALIQRLGKHVIEALSSYDVCNRNYMEKTR